MNKIVVINKEENNILHQHDKGQMIQFEEPLADGIHILMSNSASALAKRKMVENNRVEIPDELLLVSGTLVVSVVYVNDNSETTQQIAKIPILHRKEGEEGIAPENQQTFIEQMQDIMNDTKAIAEEAKEAAENVKLTDEQIKEIINSINISNIEIEEKFTDVCYGGERLYSWYKKIIDGESLYVELFGDSTMAETFISSDVMNYGKDYYIQKMIEDVVGYERLKFVNQGVGSTYTGDFVGSGFSSTSIESLYPNGYLGAKLADEADLIIVNYGINDYIRNENLTYEERLELFKNNYIEFFERLYGTEAVNGRPAIGNTLDDVCVIVMVPNIVPDSEERIQWAFDCRKVLRELVEIYPFALFDTLRVTDDHSFSSAWSYEDDNTHPNYYVNGYAMQYLRELIVPGFEKKGVENEMLEPSTVNELNPNKLYANYSINSNNGAIQNNAPNTSERFITYHMLPAKANTEYVLQKAVTDNLQAVIAFYDASKAFISSTTISTASKNYGSFITVDNASYMSVCIRRSRNDVEYDLSELMLSEGDAVKDYIPYWKIKGDYIKQYVNEKIEEALNNIPIAEGSEF